MLFACLLPSSPSSSSSQGHRLRTRLTRRVGREGGSHSFDMQACWVSRRSLFPSVGSRIRSIAGRLSGPLSQVSILPDCLLLRSRERSVRECPRVDRVGGTRVEWAFLLIGRRRLPASSL